MYDNYSFKLIKRIDEFNYGIFDSEIWSKYLKKIKFLNSDIVVINRNDQYVGYIRIYNYSFFGFRFGGSPMQGTTTGPGGINVYDGFNRSEIYKQLLQFLQKKLGYFYLEIIDENEPDASILKNSRNLKITSYEFYEIDLQNQLEFIYGNFSQNVRRKIKKANLNSLTVITEYPSSEFALSYYEMLLDVFKRKKKNPTYSKSRVIKLLNFLELKDNILCVGVFNDSNIRIAAGIFVYNKRKAFFWGGASFNEHLYLCPNELMHYHAIKTLKELGVLVYDFGGGGGYKEKFGPKKRVGFRMVYSKFGVLIRVRELCYLLYIKFIKNKL